MPIHSLQWISPFVPGITKPRAWQSRKVEGARTLMMSQAPAVSPDCLLLDFFFFFFFFFFSFIVLVLPYIDMNPPWVYMWSPSWTSSHFPPHSIPLGHPSAPAPSTLYDASNLDRRLVSHVMIYMFQCHSPISPTLALSHRVQKTVLYICAYFAVSHIGLSLPSFQILYICVSILYWCFSFWLTSLCMLLLLLLSRFSHVWLCAIP